MTDGVTSYAIFNFECGSLQWASSLGNAAVSGYNFGGHDVEQDFLSTFPQISDIACRNSPCSEFYTVLHDISGVISDSQLALAECVRLVSEDEQDFTPESFTPLPCPCSVFQAFTDFKYSLIYELCASIIPHSLCIRRTAEAFIASPRFPTLFGGYQSVDCYYTAR